MPETTITIAKSEFDRFWEEAIGKPWFIEEWYVDDDMFENLKPHETFELEVLYLAWQGEEGFSQSRPESSEWISQHDIDTGPFGMLDGLKILKKWRTAQPSTTVTLEVPKEHLAELVAFATTLGATQLGSAAAGAEGGHVAGR